MSGTSLDGVDMAYCVFDKNNGVWTYEIVKSITVDYNQLWRNKLSEAHKLSAEKLLKLDFEFGHYLGKLTSAFIKRQHLQPNLVASHGHTVFHNPKQGYTLQIGQGAALASHFDCPLAYDFRSQDITLGGQGAPLVPIGDQLLFSEYDACINLGGIANVSMSNNGIRTAWDIGVCNMALNYIAQKQNLIFDKDGKLASSGKINRALLQELNELNYYKLQSPKSIGREHFERDILPLINIDRIPITDILRTMVEHISYQIYLSLKDVYGSILFTGGGALNSFLMQQISNKIEGIAVVPNQLMIEAKEALIFAFLGALRMENEVNVLASVTGASRNHSAGSIIY